MFRLISLNIDDLYLGHIPEGDLTFIPRNELSNTKLPYTSVLIGPNGTGKSTILSYICQIFEDIKFYKENNKRNPNGVSFAYSIKYSINKNVYQITYRNLGLDLDAFKAGKARSRWNYSILLNSEAANIKVIDIEIPEHVVAVSYLPMDRFKQKKNNPNDFYQYLGLRHRSNAASPQYFLNNSLPLLFNYISESKSIKFLKEILKFMGVDEDFLGVQLEYRYKKHFFTGTLKSEEFSALFEDQRTYSERRNTSFSYEYFQKQVKGNKNLIERLVTYLNTRSLQDNIKYGRKSLLEFNLFDNLELVEELGLIHHLQKLDLLASAALIFQKDRGSRINSHELSSGEFHFLTTMISIQATIKDNSIILIDEPETSLHPNWQIKYVENLKRLFSRWSSTHFIMATHSHFIISDLENTSSEVIGISGQVPKINVRALDINTFGLSAEEVLLEIFKVPTTRNHFVYEKVGEVLDIIALRDTNDQDVNQEEINQTIRSKVKQLRDKGLDKLSKEDPLKEVIDKLLNKYAEPE